MSITDEYVAEAGRAWDERETFWLTLAGGCLHQYLSTHDKPQAADVAAIMRAGVAPPEMILESWLAARELHWIFADAEAGKTWIALHLCQRLIEAGYVVVYFDEELGPSAIADRLVAIGADPDLVEERFVYAPFPSWQVTDEDVEAHRTFLRTIGPQLALVIYDTATDALSEAELDENSGIDVTKWVKSYPEQARRLGAAQLVLDHVGHAERGRAVGSRAKRAKAKIQYLIARKERFNRAALGKVQVDLVKNTPGADIPESRAYKIGGDGKGGFTFELEPDHDPQSAARDYLDGLALKLIAAIVKTPGMSTRQVLVAVTGPQNAKHELLNALVETGQIRREKQGRSVVYYPLQASAPPTVTHGAIT